MDDIESALCTVAQRELKLAENSINATTDLRSLPGIESIKILRIVSKIERLYDVELDDDLVFQARNIAELAVAIRQRLQEKAG